VVVLEAALALPRASEGDAEISVDWLIGGEVRHDLLIYAVRLGCAIDWEG
jgi:hypothetical protein